MWHNENAYINFLNRNSDEARQYSKGMAFEWNGSPQFYTETQTTHDPCNLNQPKHFHIKQEPYDQDETEVIISVDPVVEDSPVKNKGKGNKNKTISDESSRTCKVCGRILASVSSLYVHMKSHSTNKPYNCLDCDASFTRKYYLEVHQRSHTGERPFQCDVCKKYFSQKSSLNTHKRKHTGEKPFQCDLCGKSFSAQSYLTSHQWSHYQKDQAGILHCSNCEEHFTSKNQLSQHLRIHSGTLDFVCNLCFKRFSKESYLIRHKKGVHLPHDKKKSTKLQKL